jgi:hypothetical protein
VENNMCNHQFILIEQLTRAPKANPKYDPNDNSMTGNPQSSIQISGRWKDEFGARVGCPLCGDVRIIWANGDLIFGIKGNETSHTKNRKGNK